MLQKQIIGLESNLSYTLYLRNLKEDYANKPVKQSVYTICKGYQELLSFEAVLTRNVWTCTENTRHKYGMK